MKVFLTVFVIFTPTCRQKNTSRKTVNLPLVGLFLATETGFTSTTGHW
jgi:hypothetical protein